MDIFLNYKNMQGPAVEDARKRPKFFRSKG